ncbi:Crinkler (CRN) family protein [Thraustotheca clavata]|uniref:Crinkler (CRN) family protein n=1 Tax=Thraustotheca clavata TaxID=74557 RepID=A0A1V9ZK70_9STRA|nr:Crinkler (CRN) family protein [Thraustotheca clavata]
MAPRLKTMRDDGFPAQWLTEFKKCQIAQQYFPLVGELPEFIQKELPVKISITDEMLVDWSAMIIPHASFPMDKLFCISNSGPCMDFAMRVVLSVISPLTIPGDTESSFISFWDRLIRDTLDYMKIGESNRDSKHSASTGESRPDFLYLVDSVCVFRGEEIAAKVNIEVPRNELSEKLIWSYGNAPYLFGYAAVAYKIELDVKGRLELLLAILNISLLLPAIANMCPDNTRGEKKNYATELMAEEALYYGSDTKYFQIGKKEKWEYRKASKDKD